MGTVANSAEVKAAIQRAKDVAPKALRLSRDLLYQTANAFEEAVNAGPDQAFEILALPGTEASIDSLLNALTELKGLARNIQVAKAAEDGRL